MPRRQHINILILVNTLEKGGRTKHIVEECQGLLGLGHQVWLVSFEEPPMWVGEQFGKEANWLCLPKKNKGFDFSLVKKLWSFIRRQNINVVHCHCEASSLYGGLAGRLCGRRPVTTFHRSEPRYYSSHWKNRLYFAFVKGFIAISEERKRRMISGIGLASDSVDLLHWGINFSQIDALQAPEIYGEKLGLSGKIILSLGHLGPIKGHDDSIHAIAALLSEHPDTRLYIAGDGSDSDYERLRQLIQSLNLAQNVTLLGQVTEALEWMKACDIFLQPSREEGFGLVFLEAGACRKPVVATHVGGIPDIIVHEQTGLLVKPECPDEIALALNTLLTDDAKRLEMGEAAHDRITRQFDLSEKIIDLESILKRYRYD